MKRQVGNLKFEKGSIEMQKTFFIYVLLMLGLAGCNGTGNNANTNANGAGTRSNANSTNSSITTNTNSSATNSGNTNSNSNANSTAGGDSSNDFMKEAAQGGMAEVELGKLAASKAKNAEVKAFGQKMVVDHTKANDELKAVAAKKSFTLPTDVGAEHKATMEKLQKLSGAEFDKEYITEMVKDHEKDVASFQKQSTGGTDEDVKALAGKTLPTLQTHLTMAKGINDKMK
jgi:putative membrane protein